MPVSPESDTDQPFPGVTAEHISGRDDRRFYRVSHAAGGPAIRVVVETGDNHQRVFRAYGDPDTDGHVPLRSEISFFPLDRPDEAQEPEVARIVGGSMLAMLAIPRTGQ